MTPPPRMPLVRYAWRRWLALAVIAGATLHFIGATVVPETSRYKYDFACWYTTWYAVRQGIAFYEPGPLGQPRSGAYMTQLGDQAGVPRDVPRFHYSPAFAVLGYALPQPSYRTAEITMVWVTGALWLAVLGGLSLPWWRRYPVEAAALFALGTIFPPALFTLHLGQLNIHVTVALLLMWCALMRGWQVPAGLLVALAMLAKPHVGLFLLYFLVTRRYGAAISSLVSLLGLFVLSLLAFGLEPWTIYLGDVLPGSTGGLAYIANQSVAGVVARVFITDPRLLFAPALLTGDDPFRWLSTALALAIVGATLWWIWRARGTLPLPLEFGAVVLALLLASPVSTIHHFAWAYPAIAMIWRMATRTPHDPRLWMLVATGTVLMFLPWSSFFYLFLDQPGAARWLACNTAVGAGLLWLAHVMLLRRAAHHAISVRAASPDRNVEVASMCRGFGAATRLQRPPIV